MATKKPVRAKGKEGKGDVLQSLGMVSFAAAMIAIAVVLGIWQIWKTITHMPEFRVNPREVAFQGDWIRPDVAIRSIQETAALAGNDVLSDANCPASIFEPGLAQRVAAAYAASPWVREVRSVRKRFPNRLEIDLVMREPFAIVSAAGRDYCVDETGRVLDPRIYKLTNDRRGLLAPEVRAASVAQKPVVGERWDDPAVLSGIAMVRHCREYLGAVKLKNIEMTTARADPSRVYTQACLVLANGPRVEWGRPPDSKSLVELPTEKKTAALLTIVRKEQKNLARLGDIDVRTSKVLMLPSP